MVVPGALGSAEWCWWCRWCPGVRGTGSTQGLLPVMPGWQQRVGSAVPVVAVVWVRRSSSTGAGLGLVLLVVLGVPVVPVVRPVP